MSTSPSQHHDSAPKESQKKSYRTPEFRVHGDINEITQGFGNNMTMDGQGGMAMGFKSIG